MSQENVDAFRRAQAAYNEGDWDSALAALDPNVVFDATRVAPDGEVYRGYEGVKTFWRLLRDVFGELRNEPEEVIDNEDRLFTRIRLRSTGQASGARTQDVLYQIITLDRGRATRVAFFRDRGEALEAAGLSEQAMSQENVEWIERFWRLYNRREIDAWVGMMAPDLEWHVDPEDPDRTVHRGPEAVKRYGLSWAEMMDATVQVREIFEASDDQAVAWTRVESRGGLSGAAAGQDLAFIFKLRDGLVVRVQETQDKREALEAVGLSEQDAHAEP